MSASQEMTRGVELRGDGACLELAFDGYERTMSENSDDANWVMCRINLAMSACTAQLRTSLTTQEIRYLRDELSRLLHTLEGRIELSTDEDALQLSIQMHSGGRAVVNGVLKIRGGSHVSIAFEFSSDQSYLRTALNSLQALVAAFPVVDVR